jgi:Uma2 family endonuclease
MDLAVLKTEDLPHYTYDDYIQWEGQWEIINGIPYAMAPAPMMKHQRLSVKIASQLDQLLKKCGQCKTYTTIDWQIEEDTVVQPDVLVVCGEFSEREKLLIPPVLVIEILSPSTARKDKILKYQLYQNAGVKYYCLVDPNTHSAEVFTLKAETYQTLEPFKEGKVTFDLDSCIIQFDFNEIFASL